MKREKRGLAPVDQVLKSVEPMMTVSKVVRRHSPAGVCHAVDGSRPVLCTGVYACMCVCVRVYVCVSVMQQVRVFSCECR